MAPGELVAFLGHHDRLEDEARGRRVRVALDCPCLLGREEVAEDAGHRAGKRMGTGPEGRGALGDEGGAEGRDEGSRPRISGLHDEEAAVFPEVGDEGPCRLEGSFAQGPLVLPEELVEDVGRRKEVGPLREGGAYAVLPELDAPGREASLGPHAEGLEDREARLHDAFDPVYAIEGEGNVAQLGPGGVECDGKGEGTRTEVDHDSLVGEAEIGIGEYRRCPVDVPGQEVS